MSYFLYEDKFEYDTWLKLLLGSVVVLLVVLVAIAAANDSGQAIAVFIAPVFVITLMYFILPRRIQIHSDRLKIILGGPLALTIPLTDIQEVKLRSGILAFIFVGMRFATSAEHTVEIIRNRGLNVVVSPSNTGEFVERLNQALAEFNSYITQEEF